MMSRDRIAEVINFVPQRWETVPRTLIWRPVPWGSQMPGPHLRPVHASRSAGSSRPIERRKGKGESSPAGEGGRLEWWMECREAGPEINKGLWGSEEVVAWLIQRTTYLEDIRATEETPVGCSNLQRNRTGHEYKAGGEMTCGR